MQRLFVGISLPGQVQFELSEAYFNGLGGVRWTPIEQLHLTLTFMGDVEPHLEDLIVDTLSRVEYPPFQMELGDPKVLTFGNRPGVIYLPVISPEIHGLKQAIDSVLKDEIEPELRLVDRDHRRGDKKRLSELRHYERNRNDSGKRFVPHITLARVSKNGARATLSEIIRYTNTYAGRTWPAVEVDRFTLFSSVLSPKRAYHTAECDFPLFWSEGNQAVAQ